ncbi:MAG: hypothetical protein M3478_09025 [Planctomycetota bacterium]|nr:hypothetical protein [Planctomycetota bacterium]
MIFTTAERNNLWLQHLSGGDAVKITAFTDQTLFRVALLKSGTLIASRGGQVRDAFLMTNFR